MTDANRLMKGPSTREYGQVLLPCRERSAPEGAARVLPQRLETKHADGNKWTKLHVSIVNAGRQRPPQLPSLRPPNHSAIRWESESA